MPEQWRPVPGHDGYEISDYGQVRSPVRDGWNASYLKGSSRCYRRATPNNRGYLQITIQGKAYLVHRLVLLSWIGPPPTPKHVACHNDGNQQNNHISNLRWDTHAANTADAIRHGTARPHWHAGMSHNVGEAHGRAVLTENIVRAIRSSREPGTVWAQRLGVNKATITLVRKRKRWAHVD